MDEMEKLKDDPGNIALKFADGSYAVLRYMPYDFVFHPGFDFCFVKSSDGKLYKSKMHFCMTPFPEQERYDEKNKEYVLGDFDEFLRSMNGDFKSF